MQYELKGKVHFIGVLEQITDSFAKRVIVIETEGEYPQTVPFEFHNANTGKVDAVKVGQLATVHFNLRGNASKTDATRFFANLQGWKIEAEVVAAPAPIPAPAAPAAAPVAAAPVAAAPVAAAPVAAAPSIDDIGEDDLPF